MRTNKFIAAISAAVAVSTFATIAEARCTRLAFSVNDYGKQGPTDDAKRLLDTYIAKWAAERNVKQYTTGKKDVSCELFLDFGVFDEHTCKAAATVCWPGNEDFASRAPIPGAEAAVKAAASKPAVKTKTAAAKPATITTGSIPAPATAVKAAAPAPDATPAPAAPAPAAPTPIAAPAAAPADAPKPQ
jgi:hypothetical protein